MSQPPVATAVPSSALWLLCRAGFESELAAELHGAMPDAELVMTTAPALVRVTGPTAALDALAARLRQAPAVFARDALMAIAVCAALPRGNRIQPLLAALGGEAFAAAEVIAPDAPAAGPLAPMLKKKKKKK